MRQQLKPLDVLRWLLAEERRLIQVFCGADARRAALAPAPLLYKRDHVLMRLLDERHGGGQGRTPANGVFAETISLCRCSCIVRLRQLANQHNVTESLPQMCRRRANRSALLVLRAEVVSVVALSLHTLYARRLQLCLRCRHLRMRCVPRAG